MTVSIRASSEEHQRKILLIGDSLCEGLSPHFRKNFNNQEFSSHCVGGTTTKQWIKLASHDVNKTKPRLVLVSLGTNDAGENFKYSDKESYKKISKIVEENGALLIWVSPPELNKKKLPYAEPVRELIKESTSNYFDSTKIQFSRTSDGIHATSEGYATWTLSIMNWLKEKKFIE